MGALSNRRRDLPPNTRLTSYGIAIYTKAGGRYRAKHFRFTPTLNTPQALLDFHGEAMRVWLAMYQTTPPRGGAELPEVIAARQPLPKSLDGWCYIYFLQDDDRVKVGRATDMGKRFHHFQGATSRPLRVLACVPAHAALEPALHQRFAPYRIKGEWFRLVPPIVEFITRLNTGVNPVALLWEDNAQPGA